MLKNFNGLSRVIFFEDIGLAGQYSHLSESEPFFQMKTIYFCLLLFLICSCNQQTQSSKSNSIHYALDTLTIDSNGEILDLKYSLEYSGHIPGQPFLYNFNHFDHSLEKIDLDKGQLIDKIPFQKEGPHGTGNGFTTFQLLDTNRLLISNSFDGAMIFNLEGNKLKKINFKDHSWNGQKLSDKEISRTKIMTNGSSSKLFSIVSEEGLNSENRAELAVFDIDHHTISRFNIDPERKINSYALISTPSADYACLFPKVYLSLENGLPLISHEYFNDIYWYDSTSHRTRKVDYKSQLTPSEVATSLPNKFDSRKALFTTFEKMAEQIRFGPVRYDKKNETYYRLSFRYQFMEKERKESFIPEVKEIATYLTLFNKDFKLIGESLIPELNSIIPHYFVKDGRLWIFINTGDEMSFIRLQPDLENQ